MSVIDTVKSNPWYLVIGVAVVGGVAYMLHQRGVF